MFKKFSFEFWNKYFLLYEINLVPYYKCSSKRKIESVYTNIYIYIYIYNYNYNDNYSYNYNYN